MFYRLLVLSALLTPGCEGQKQDLPHVVAFGDSTTAIRDTIDRVYVDRLVPKLASRGVPITVYNAGMRGSHTGRLTDHDLLSGPHALERLDAEVLQQDPDIVLIQYGINDAYIDGTDPGGPSRIAIENFEANLHFMIAEIQKVNAIPVLMTPNQLGEPEPLWKNERLSAYAAVVRRLAQTADLPLIDLWQILPRSEANTYLLDGVHPNDAGHERIATAISTRLVALLAHEPK